MAAQATRGTIAGTVNARGLGPVFPATVVLVEVETGSERRAVTDASGAFVFGGLTPGKYRVRVQEAPFTPFATGDLDVAAGERRTLAIQLLTIGPGPDPSSGQATAPAADGADFLPVPDRWRLELPVWQRYPATQGGEHPYARSHPRSPYAQNRLKGDRPVIGQDVFAVLTMVSESMGEYRRLASDEEGGDARPLGAFTFELFKGDTAFRPRDWALRFTAAANRRGVALQEAFAERRLAEVGPHFDVVSMRAGIQPFTSDFRGFLFRDTNLGVRLYGSWGRNRNQWNVALFDTLEKDRDAELNRFGRRDQQVLVANYYRQDFLTPGYTVSPGVIATRDGDRVTAYYLGLGGDGHWGRLNVTHQAYAVFGHDDFNPVEGGAVDVRASFAAIEASIDRDWQRFKVSLLFASGDDDPGDGRGHGFDAIDDNPNFAGGVFSFWNRQEVRAAAAEARLVPRNSLLPSLRGNGPRARASFVNPGLLLGGAGWDADWTRKLRSFAHANVLRFHRTGALDRFAATAGFHAIGIDYGAGVRYRPLLIDNVIVTGGVSALTPMTGLRRLAGSRTLFAPFVALTLAY